MKSDLKDLINLKYQGFASISSTFDIKLNLKDLIDQRLTFVFQKTNKYYLDVFEFHKNFFK